MDAIISSAATPDATCRGSVNIGGHLKMLIQKMNMIALLMSLGVSSEAGGLAVDDLGHCNEIVDVHLLNSSDHLYVCRRVQAINPVFTNKQSVGTKCTKGLCSFRVAIVNAGGNLRHDPALVGVGPDKKQSLDVGDRNDVFPDELPNVIRDLLRCHPLWWCVVNSF
jgi:hypothetical protein